jgi:hypothetical protein
METSMAKNKKNVVSSGGEKMDFEAWFAMRESAIPRQHYKEIIRADFNGQGLSQCESQQDFDEALKTYGVKLDLA